MNTHRHPYTFSMDLFPNSTLNSPVWSSIVIGALTLDRTVCILSPLLTTLTTLNKLLKLLVSQFSCLANGTNNAHHMGLNDLTCVNSWIPSCILLCSRQCGTIHSFFSKYLLSTHTGKQSWRLHCMGGRHALSKIL